MKYKLKSAEELKKIQPLITGSFEDVEDVLSQFNSKDKPSDLTEGQQIIYANYDTPAWEGDAQVFGYNNITGDFFEVYGGHCSCYGLEDQWDVEIVPKEVIIDRMNTDKGSQIEIIRLLIGERCD